MNNVSNNPIHNRGVAAANQTSNSASASSRAGWGLSNTVASLASALNKQITDLGSLLVKPFKGIATGLQMVKRDNEIRRGIGKSMTPNQPVNTTLNDLGSLLVKPFKGIATGLQMAKRDNEIRSGIGKS